MWKQKKSFDKELDSFIKDDESIREETFRISEQS